MSTETGNNIVIAMDAASPSRSNHRVLRLLFWSSLVLWVFVMWRGIMTGTSGISPERKETISISVLRDSVQTNRFFRAEIDHTMGRKGPYASLQVYRVPDEIRNAVIQVDDSYTTPELIWSASTSLFRPHTVTVTEREWLQYRSASISQVENDDDYEPEFLIHQPEDANRRQMPVETGTYILDFNRQKDRWELTRISIWRFAFAIDWVRRSIESGLLLLALIAGSIGGLLGAATIPRVVLKAIIGTVLVLVMLPVDWYLAFAVLVVLMSIVFAVFRRCQELKQLS